MLTLGDGKSKNDKQYGLNTTSRSKIIQEQCHDAGIHLAGIQEARTSAATRITDLYHIFSGGADEHSAHGCELWCAKLISINSIRDLHVKTQHIAISHSDPTRIYAAIRANPMNLDAFVMHAPHSLRPLEERRQWWSDSISIALARQTPGIPLVIFIDSNGRVGSNISQSIGGLCPDLEDSNGAFLHTFCIELHICLPSTFPVSYTHLTLPTTPYV